MVRSRKRLTLMALLAGAIIMGVPPPAGADFRLTLHQDGFADRTITDNSIYDLSPTTTGVIVYSGTFGTFTITAEIGTSNSTAGVEPAALTINQLSIASPSGGTLTITLSDDGFTAPQAGQQVAMRSQLSSTSLTSGGSVSFQSYLEGVGGTVLTLGTANPNGIEATDIRMLGATPYTLSNVTTVTLAPSGVLQSTGTTTVMNPAPAGLVLALTGVPLLGIGAWLRRFRKRP